MFITSISHCVELVAQVALKRLDDAHSLKGSAAAAGGGGGGAAAAGGGGGAAAAGGSGVGGGGRGGEISNNERLSNELYTFFPVQENYFQRQDILISGSLGSESITKVTFMFWCHIQTSSSQDFIHFIGTSVTGRSEFHPNWRGQSSHHYAGDYPGPTAHRCPHFQACFFKNI